MLFFISGVNSKFINENGDQTGNSDCNQNKLFLIKESII